MKLSQILLPITLLVSTATSSYIQPLKEETKRGEFSDLMIQAAKDGHAIFSSGAFNVSYIEKLVGDLAHLGELAVAYISDEKQHYVFDVYTGRKLSPISRPEPEQNITFIEYSKSSNSSVGEFICLNNELNNANSGICGYTGCNYGSSGNCTSQWYDCCIAKAVDSNGRSECSQAICKRTSLLSASYSNGGCCRGKE